jgi:hypothetical protein
VDHGAGGQNQLGTDATIMNRTSIKIKNDATTMISNLADGRVASDVEVHEK